LCDIRFIADTTTNDNFLSKTDVKDNIDFSVVTPGRDSIEKTGITEVDGERKERALRARSFLSPKLSPITPVFSITPWRERNLFGIVITL